MVGRWSVTKVPPSVFQLAILGLLAEAPRRGYEERQQRLRAALDRVADKPLPDRLRPLGLEFADREVRLLHGLIVDERQDKARPI